jgi:hypothetical protein
MRIVVTLTTIPTREDSVVKSIRSIQEGTVKPDVIYVNLPNWYPKFNRGPDPSLEATLKDLGVIVTRCEDYGSLTKIVPTLRIETDPSTLVVILDDDVTYQPRVIEGLVNGYMEHKCAVCYSSITYPETTRRHNIPCDFLLVQGHGQPAEIMECSFGVLIPRGAFDHFPTIEPLSETSDKNFYFSDDYVLSKFLDSQQIPKKVACYSWVGRQGDDWTTIWKLIDGSQTHSLSREGNFDRYKRLNI